MCWLTLFSSTSLLLFSYWLSRISFIPWFCYLQVIFLCCFYSCLFIVSCFLVSLYPQLTAYLVVPFFTVPITTHCQVLKLGRGDSLILPSWSLRAVIYTLSLSVNLLRLKHISHSHYKLENTFYEVFQSLTVNQ